MSSNRKRILRTLVAALAVACALTVCAKVNEKPFVVPELTSWSGAEGMTSLSGRVVVKNNAMKEVAKALIK